MTDTAPDVAARYRSLLLRRSGSERLKMACGMFDATRRMLIAGIKADHPGLSEQDIRVLVFERTYGTDFTPEERERIVTRLRGA